MAGLGLMNAVRAYQEGVQFRQQQDQYDRQQKQQELADNADKAAAGVVDQSKAEWALNGAQGDYTPSDSTLMRAAEARGRAFAQGGDWQNYLKNEAAVQQQRIRVRASALQKYQQDGDPTALAQTVYPTVFDGKQIAKIEKVGGMPALGSIGREATPAVLRYTLSDGTEGEMPVDQMVAKVKQSLIDPVAAAQKEVELNFLRTKSEIEGDQKVRVEGVKGAEDRKTEEVKGKSAVGLAGVKAGFDRELHGMDNASRERVGLGNNGATVRAAQIAADGRVDAAEVRGSRGGGAGASNGLLKTAADADGNVILYFRDGTSRKAVDPDTGKALKSGDWGTRIDRLAKTLAEAPANFGKSPADLRQLAADTLASTPSSKAAAPKPGLSSFSGSGDKPPLSTFSK